MSAFDVGLLGYGRVGQAVAALAAADAPRLAAAGIALRPVAALIRDRAKPRGGPVVPLYEDAARFFDRRLDVVIDVMGGVHPAGAHVRRALECGVPVVTANKTLMAERGPELRAIARSHGTSIACDAAVLAGVPFLGALARRPLIGAPRRLTGIVNGTSHFLLSALAAGASFREALEEAVARGYAEPDSRADISGRDAAEKLTILGQLAGCHDLAVSDLTTTGIDAISAADFAAARALGGVIKPIAMASFDPATAGAWVGPALMDARHPSASSRGTFNFIEFEGRGEVPVTFSGPGAGPEITAATILDDVVETLSGTTRRGACAAAGRCGVSRGDLRRPPAGPWYLRVAGGGALRTEDAAELLAAHRLPAVRASRVAGTFAARTIAAAWPAVRTAASVFTAIGADVLVLPVIEGPPDA